MSHQDRVFFGNFMAVLGVLVVLAVGFFLIASSVVDDDEISPAMIERANLNIQPVGKVRVEGDAEPAAAPAAMASAPAPEPATAAAPSMEAIAPASAETIYNRSCMACHMTGAAGAPKLGDNAAWSARIAQGMDTLVGHAISGFKAMPPKGGCMACSDDEIRATVEYMVGKSQ